MCAAAHGRGLGQQMAPSHRRRLALLGFHVDGGRSRPPALVTVAAAAAADTSSPWATATEDSRCIKVETELLQATIVKNNPKHWMTGVEKHSFVDKATGADTTEAAMAIMREKVTHHRP